MVVKSLNKIIKNISKLVIVACITLTLCACGNNNDVASWKVGTSDPTSSVSAAIGSMYLNQSTFDLFQLTDSGWTLVGNIKGQNGTNGKDGITPTISINEDGYWVINGQVTSIKAEGKDGINGTNGTDGKTPTIEIKDGYWIVNGVNTNVKAEGVDGKDGTDVYIGYDNYVWNGKERIELKLENTNTKNVIETTIGIEGTMSKYFDNGYLDLSTNVVALMSTYKPTAKITLYSGISITEITIYAEKDGKLSIGTAKVEDVVKARTNGTTITATTTQYNVTKGLNTITLDLSINENETLVLGGNNSVGLYYASGISVSDDIGAYSLINGKTNSSLLNKTNNLNDKIVIRTKAVINSSETAVLPNVTKDFPTSGISSSTSYNQSFAPFAYADLDYFAGKKLTKIGIPVKSVSAINDQQYITLSIISAESLPTSAIIKETIKIYLPVDQLGNSTTVNKWIYADVRDLDINVAENETIAFVENGDPVVVGYKPSKVGSGEYAFMHTFLKGSGTVSANGNESLFWDVYVASETTIEEHKENLNQKEQEAIQNEKIAKLQTAIQGKNFSILGNSISTYAGYSNNATTTNSTIGSNAVYYTGSNYVTNVNDTWWMQTVNTTKMNLLVNNSWSGDYVTNRGETRAVQLHDDTGDNAGTNPDIIAVYLGINDYDNNVTIANFETGYDKMIKALTEKYTNADVFLFNFVPNKSNSRPVSDMVAYNKIVKDTATKYGCALVNLYENSGITSSNIANYMGDSGALHPNVAGMTAMSKTFINVLINTYVK